MQGRNDEPLRRIRSRRPEKSDGYLKSLMGVFYLLCLMGVFYLLCLMGVFYLLCLSVNLSIG